MNCTGVCLTRICLNTGWHRWFAIVRLGSFDWECLVAIVRLGSFTLGLPFEIFRLGSVAWELSLGNSSKETFLRSVLLERCRLATFALELLLGIFGLGSFAWNLCYENFRMVSSRLIGRSRSGVRLPRLRIKTNYRSHSAEK